MSTRQLRMQWTDTKAEGSSGIGFQTLDHHARVCQIAIATERPQSNRIFGARHAPFDNGIALT